MLASSSYFFTAQVILLLQKASRKMPTFSKEIRKQQIELKHWPVQKNKLWILLTANQRLKKQQVNFHSMSNYCGLLLFQLITATKRKPLEIRSRLLLVMLLLIYIFFSPKILPQINASLLSKCFYVKNKKEEKIRSNVKLISWQTVFKIYCSTVNKSPNVKSENSFLCDKLR